MVRRTTAFRACQGWNAPGLGIQHAWCALRRQITLLAALAILVLAWTLWRSVEVADESERRDAVVDTEQAAIQRTLERTLRESRSGVELPPTVAPPVVDSAPPLAFPAPTESIEPGSSEDQLPEGYALGNYRGAMQRAQRTTDTAPELVPNPGWLGAADAQDAILDQAAQSGREFTFAVLRVGPGADLQSLNRSLTSLGARIEGSTGSNVRARVPAERSALDRIATLPEVLGVGVVPPELKTDEAFVQSMLARPAGEQAPVYITLMAADPGGEWRRALTELGAVVGAYDRDLRSYTANLPAGSLAQVVAADFVMSVEPVRLVTTNHGSSVPAMGVDGFRSYDADAELFSGITGSGIAVGVLDTGLNTSHLDIAHGRASICGASLFAEGNENWDLWLDLNGHGTHVFGTIAGAGRVNPVLAGIAPGLSHLRFGKVLSSGGNGVDEDIRRGMDYLSRATSCTWRGAPSEAVKPLIVNMSLAAVALTHSGRGVGERKLDSVVHGHSQLYVVAQANSGLHGFSNLGTAKNSLAVGAVNDTGIIAWFSSHGPTADGRLAPNVVATGVGLTSARGSASISGHVTYSGTSMAAPSVSGVAALLMEARPEYQNRPALARARLMASAIRPHAYLESRAQLPADNTDGPGEFNNLYGLGLVSARTTLLSRDDPEGWLIGSATSSPDNDTYEYIDIEVPEGAGRLDVVLTWDEQPADTLTRSVLNNLDLWADQGADCAADACGEHASRSEIDNVEWLMIEDPVPGTYRIKVVPVEIYGESSTAAVAWKILRNDPVPELDVEIEDTSASANSEYITLDVTVNASHYVASGTTIHLGCPDLGKCSGLQFAFVPHRTRIDRRDGLEWTDPISEHRNRLAPIAIGEVVSGTPKRLQLRFLREDIREAEALVVTASAWNARAAAQSLSIGPGAANTGEPGDTTGPPENDSFVSSQLIASAAGEAPVDLLRASREPGERLVAADSRTVWFTWEAPTKGIYRFRLQSVQSHYLVDAHLTAFTGDTLVNLDVAATKVGHEISFPAQAGTVYRLRVAVDDEWRLPPVLLTWERADLRPANDDFAYAQMIEGDRGSLESSNEGATLESAEFMGGAAATVWYQWTAPADGWWRFHAAGPRMSVHVFVGEQIGELRLVSTPRWSRNTRRFPAKRGETYRIAVAARSAHDSVTEFELIWHPLDDVSSYVSENDAFADAIEIEGAEGLVDQIFEFSGSAYNYTVEHDEPVATGAGTGWWRWTAPSDGRFTWTMDGYNSAWLTIFTGDALDNLELVGSLRGGSALRLDATAGTRYWIAVGFSPETIGNSNFWAANLAWGADACQRRPRLGHGDCRRQRLFQGHAGLRDQGFERACGHRRKGLRLVALDCHGKRLAAILGGGASSLNDHIRLPRRYFRAYAHPQRTNVVRQWAC